MLQRTSCGPDAPMLASSVAAFEHHGLRSSDGRLVRAARSRILANFSDPRARRKPLKPLRAGTPGDSGVLVVTRVLSTATSAHEAAGATGIRRSPRPLWARDFMQSLGRFAPRVRGCVFRRHCERSSLLSPPCGGELERGVATSTNLAATPLPNPPPQGQGYRI
jgi:hypothetical protein